MSSTRTMGDSGLVVWDRHSSILELAADRTFGSALRRMRQEGALWVVIVRPQSANNQVYYYAFRNSELEQLAAEHPERSELPIEQAMDMHEWKSSGVSRNGRPVGAASGNSGPAASRIVELNAKGRITAVGQRTEELVIVEEAVNIEAGAEAEVGLPAEATSGSKGEVHAERGMDLDLGPMRGRTRAIPPSNEPTSPPFGAERSIPEVGARDVEIDVTLSAETNAQIDVNASARVPFQIELTAEAMPLAVSQAARAKKGVPIVVSLSAENDAIEIVRNHEFTVDPPDQGQPRTGFFIIKGIREGLCRLAVLFRQGGSELGIIGLAVDVVAAGAGSEKSKGTATAAPPDIADDDKLALLIEQRTEGGQVFYDYTLHSEALGFAYRRVRSKPLLDRGGGPAATAIAFVERIYERVTTELKSLDDLKELQREARALGANLCLELFDPEVAKLLWPLRDRINLVQIVSWEPYIPWELVRLCDPDSDDIDDRFLCEYGLVRTVSDEMPVKSLPMVDWAYLGATFPMGSFPPVGAELDYFSTTSANSLQGHGIAPKPIPATRDAFYDALAAGDFDVLHISCHAESPQQAIDRASLIIGDETVPGQSNARLIEVDTTTVEAEARLKKRHPLIFLNACETGRVGAVLTAWGGWPNVFMRKGAGAFVGASWEVRDKPAAVFSTTFYNAMLAGKMLSEAATAARAAAKAMGDASWLAFKVYGHPRARRASA